MRNLAVFDTPAMPDGWDGREVARIVDPLGTGVAWIDPRLAGLCVGFSVRASRGDGWVPVFESAPPDGIGVPGGVACEPIWAAPGRAAMPARLAGSWALETRDPTAATVVGSIGGRSVRCSARFDGGALVLTAGGCGDLGFRVHLRDVDVGTGEGARLDAVADRFPAGVLRCAGSPTLWARWRRLECGERLVSMEWLPVAREIGSGSDDGEPVSLVISPG